MTISSSMATFWDSGTFGRGAFNRRDICSIFSLIADTVEACALAIFAQYFQKVAGSWCQWTGSSTVDGCRCAENASKRDNANLGRRDSTGISRTLATRSRASLPLAPEFVHLRKLLCFPFQSALRAVHSIDK